MKATPKNFVEALNVFNTYGKIGNGSIRLGNNTYLETYADGTRIDCFKVRLHNTHIVTFWHDGRITLNTGGYRTVTTKARINQFLVDGRIYQRNGQWFYQEFSDGIVRREICFSEGLLIN